MVLSLVLNETRLPTPGDGWARVASQTMLLEPGVQQNVFVPLGGSPSQKHTIPPGNHEASLTHGLRLAM